MTGTKPPIRYTPRQLVMLGAAALLLIALFFVTRPPATPAQLPPGSVSRSIMGEAWPLTVEDGVLAYDGSPGIGAVTLTTGGTTYAVNGIASQRGAYADIKSIWADDPNAAGLKKDIGPLIERGLALC